MKTRKIASLIIALILTLSLIAGCNGASPAASTTQASDTVSTASGAPETTGAKAPAAKAEYTMRVAHILNAEGMGGIQMQKISDLIKEHSNGRIDFKMYPNAQLGDKTASLEGLLAGTIEMTECAASDMSAYMERWSVFCLPFMFPDQATAKKVYTDPEVLGVLDADCQSAGFKLLAMQDPGSRSLMNTKRPINEPADCVGLKMRTMQDRWVARAFSDLGFGVVVLNWSEIYTALQQKTIDAVDNSPPYLYDARLHEVSKYFSETEMIRLPDPVLVSLSFYKKLPADLQQAVDAASAEFMDWQWNYCLSYIESARKKMADAGVKINTITPENRQKFLDATSGLRNDMFKEVPGTQEIYDLLMKKGLLLILLCMYPAHGCAGYMANTHLYEVTCYAKKEQLSE